MGHGGVLFMRLIVVLIWCGVLLATPSIASTRSMGKFLSTDPCAQPGSTNPGCVPPSWTGMGPPANRYTRPCTKANGCQRDISGHPGN
ncbi:hypothetical protein AMTRI_Chr02g265380 [Amborella trichopoda]|uniref:Rapid ALkalinization Factor n=1 Tax=Amborella trichopoda TaxID=13333 RepID=W1P3K2_AMBTC|nr:hypothetical protein AMTR_s00045p00207440 [Amborella trichopoda]